MTGVTDVADRLPVSFSRMTRIDEWADRWSDRFNPVVVREIRQEFQGRRLSITLLLSLGGAWLSSVFGVLSMLDRIRYQADLGESMFAVFFVILSFPLCIVIPFGLFRSMTSEFVGSTWELLVITPMKPSKIVRGKLATAMLQAALYMALQAPFLCFAWLLKGIGMTQIVIGLVLLGIVSFCLCPLALFCGSLVRKAAWQGLGMIALMAGSLVSWGILIGVVSNLTGMSVETWIGGGICFGIGLLYLVIVASATAVASLTPTYPIHTPVDQLRVAGSRAVEKPDEGGGQGEESQ